MRRCLNILLLTAAAALALACSGRTGRTTDKLLHELDGYLEARSMYDARKLDQMDGLSRLLKDNTEPRRRFEVEMSIAAGFFSFSFDSTRTHLRNARELAEQTGNADCINRASIQLGHLYAKAGNYIEAYNLLYGQIDTTTLTPERKLEYLLALYDFSMDLGDNSGMVEKLEIAAAAPIRNRLLGMLPRNSRDWRILWRDRYTENGKLQAADSLARILVASTSPEEHEYAIHAYHVSEIAQRQGRTEEQLTWLIRSAESDMICAVKDYASLTMVAQLILPTDVDRSFRYLQIAQEDAIFYNAKLRPWQISRFMLDVQDAYTARHERSGTMLRIAAIMLGILTLLLSLGAAFLIARSRKLAKLRKELEQSNENLAAANRSLNVMNKQISEADRLKEEYILSFLDGLSAQISTLRTEDNRFRNLLKQGKSEQLLKELSISGRSEKARDEFYETFDHTFLALYPDFVQQFNALLLPEARITPPKGRLNTELRIFALIRLGVDDSKRIASMLDYSLSTIYNRKVAVKNAAAVERSKFEDYVKSIGLA